jgi:hypothetical protein
MVNLSTTIIDHGNLNLEQVGMAFSIWIFSIMMVSNQFKDIERIDKQHCGSQHCHIGHGNHRKWVGSGLTHKTLD